LQLSSVWQSPQLRHSLNTAAVVTQAAVAVVPMVAAVAATIAAPAVAADILTQAPEKRAAAPMARDPQAEEAAIEAARRQPAAQAALEVRRQTFVPRSTTASGIRLATRTAPQVPTQDELPLQQAQT
jgi:hypothetical protein